MTDADVVDLLQPQTLFPHGYRHPQRTLVVFEPVASSPGCPPGELNIVEDNENIRKAHAGEKSGARSEIGPAGGYNHCLTTEGVDHRLGKRQSSPLYKRRLLIV